MNNKLFIGSLSFNVTEDELRELFATAGTVTSVSIIKDRDTDRSKGFGFVEMSTDQEAQEAIKALNGKELDGRALVVNIAKPKTDRPSRPNFSAHRRY